MKNAFVLALLLTLSLSASAQEARVFVFVMIPDRLQPLERAEKYEDPLNASLQKENLGEVTGGGSMLAKDKTIEWVGLDIDLLSLTKGLPFLCKELVRLGAPPTSTLEYESGGKKITASICPDSAK